MTTAAAPSLSRNPEFLKLWVGQTISVFGSQITGLALPLTAVLILNASASQMGLLNALGIVPFILVGLFAGVFADRARRRPILMVADFGRFILLAVVPVAALGGFLTMNALYVIIFLIGVLGVFFDISYQAYLPSLVGREQIVEGNSKLEVSNSAAAIVGPGIAGLLIQALTAPIAVIFDALSFLISALSLSLIRSQEVVAERPHNAEQHVLLEIREGLNVVLSSRVLRSIAACTATTNFFFSIWHAVYILYLTRELNMPPAVQGVIYAAGAPGALLAALLSARIAKRIGLGNAIIGAIFLSNAASLLIIFARGPQWLAAVMLVASGFFSSFGSVVYNVNQVSLRQSITPDRLLGRMNASMRVIVWGTIPLGALVGGALGERIGLMPTIVIGTVFGAVSFLWVFFSPVRQLREVPASESDHA